MKVKLESDNPLMLTVTYYTEDKAVLSFRIYEKGKSNTTYFNRKYGSKANPVTGRGTIKFPFPDKFEKLGIDVKNVLNSSTVKIENISQSPLMQRGLQVKALTKDYITFAAEFAKKCGYISTAEYGSDCGKFQINLLSRIRDSKTGKLIETPARVNHMTGIIEVSKKDFEQMTVCNRLYILLHEWAHFANNTDNEVECDMLAAKTCMELGYSAIECLYAVSKLFMYNMEIDAKLRLDQEARVLKVKDFINRYGVL